LDATDPMPRHSEIAIDPVRQMHLWLKPELHELELNGPSPATRSLDLIGPIELHHCN
jgi:hypothetical protein